MNLNFVVCIIIAIALVWCYIKSDSNEKPAMFLGAFLGIQLAFQLVLGFMKNDTEYQAYKENRKRIEVCEKDLPRSQKCVLIAVPQRKE